MKKRLHKYFPTYGKFTGLCILAFASSPLFSPILRADASDVDLSGIESSLANIYTSLQLLNNALLDSNGPWNQLRIDLYDDLLAPVSGFDDNYLQSLPSLSILNEQTEQMLGSLYGTMSGHAMYRTGITDSGNLQYGYDLPTLLSQQLNIINTREIVGQYQLHTLLNQLLPRQIDTPDPLYWQRMGLNPTNAANSRFTSVYSNIWRSLPNEFRRNNLGSYGFGTPNENMFSAETSNPDTYSRGYLEAILYWLMRNSAELTAQNRWQRMGGLFGSRNRDYAYRGYITNDQSAPLAFTLYQTADQAVSGDNVILPFPSSESSINGEAQFWTLPEFFSYQSLPLNMLLDDVYDDNFSRSIDVTGRDWGFYRFVNSMHEDSFFNSPDNPETAGQLTNGLPNLYYEDQFIPFSVSDWGTPPRIENYMSFQLAKLVNRGTILAYAVTNRMNEAVSNIVDSIWTPDEQTEAEDTKNNLDSRLEPVLASISSVPGYDLPDKLDDVQDVLSDLQASSDASVPVSIPSLSHIDFDLPDPSSLGVLSNVLIWFYRVVFFCLYCMLVRGEIGFWVKVISVVDVELPGGGHVRHTDWGDL